jgi:hypothetical protein
MPMASRNVTRRDSVTIRVSPFHHTLEYAVNHLWTLLGALRYGFADKRLERTMV